MRETSTVQGEIRVLGLIHLGAAINTMVVRYEDPENWEMKQFVSDQQLNDYAMQERMVVVRQE
jgi:hypothetical protein